MSYSRRRAPQQRRTKACLGAVGSPVELRDERDELRTLPQGEERYRFAADAAETVGLALSLELAYLASAERQFPLAEGEAVIGRARDAAIRVGSGGVSRRHARIIVRGAEARVEDWASKNGTFVAGVRVTAARLLREGDETRVGPVALTFRVATTTAATETIGRSRAPSASRWQHANVARHGRGRHDRCGSLRDEARRDPDVRLDRHAIQPRRRQLPPG